MSAVLPWGDFHHLGVATQGIARESAPWRALGYVEEGPVFEDPVQGVAGQFFAGAGPRIELLENLPGSSTLTPWLDAGIKVYHSAYEVHDLAAALERARAERARLIVAPVPAVAFGGRRICFLALRGGWIVELIETALPAQAPAGEAR